MPGLAACAASSPKTLRGNSFTNSLRRAFSASEREEVSWLDQQAVQFNCEVVQMLGLGVRAQCRCAGLLHGGEGDLAQRVEIVGELDPGGQLRGIEARVRKKDKLAPCAAFDLADKRVAQNLHDALKAGAEVAEWATSRATAKPSPPRSEDTSTETHRRHRQEQ